MKLILNGGGEGNQVKSARELLNSLIDHSKKILYIPLAWVDSNYDSCLEFMTDELSDVDCAGIEMVRSGDEIVNKNLNDYACIYIGGGNTYKLLSELKTSGAFDKIRDYLINKDGIVYGGSAGAIIFGKDLDSCNTDDDNEVGLIDNTGFDMINGYSLLCHYTSRNKERTELSRKHLLELSKTKPVYAIPEEDTIFVNDGNIEFLGNRPYYEFREGVIKVSNITVRRYKDGDAPFICKVIKEDVLAENIKDYPIEIIDNIIKNHDEALIERRASKFHVYVLEDNNIIVGVGMIGPYWDSLTESSFFTIFIDPRYKGLGLGRKIIKTLEQDEYYKRADRIEIPASLTALEFYKHFGFGFKKMGHIASVVDGEGIYKLEKYPKISDNNCNPSQYNMRPYIDNEYHNYKEFVYQTKKKAYKKYVEECWGSWVEEDQRKYYENFIKNVEKDTWIIQLNGIDIGFYNGMTLDDGSYEIGNICIIPEYQGKGIGTQVLKDIIELHKEQDIHIQYFKQNPVCALYERLGFISNGETQFHYQMIKYKEDIKKVGNK